MYVLKQADQLGELHRTKVTRKVLLTVSRVRMCRFLHLNIQQVVQTVVVGNLGFLGSRVLAFGVVQVDLVSGLEVAFDVFRERAAVGAHAAAIWLLLRVGQHVALQPALALRHEATQLAEELQLRPLLMELHVLLQVLAVDGVQAAVVTLIAHVDVQGPLAGLYRVAFLIQVTQLGMFTLHVNHKVRLNLGTHIVTVGTLDVMRLKIDNKCIVILQPCMLWAWKFIINAYTLCIYMYKFIIQSLNAMGLQMYNNHKQPQFLTKQLQSFRPYISADIRLKTSNKICKYVLFFSR